MKHIYVPYKGEIFGILRWISKRIEIKNLYGNDLVNLSVDSNSKGNIAAPIGYVINDQDWWQSGSQTFEHFYIVDFKTFRTSIKGILISMSTQHFHKTYNINGSNDGTTWHSIKEACFPSQPSSSLQFISFDSFVNYRYYKISTNDTRFDGSNILVFGPLDFYGSILWDVGYTCKHYYKRTTNIYFILICILPPPPISNQLSICVSTSELINGIYIVGQMTLTFRSV